MRKIMVPMVLAVLVASLAIPALAQDKKDDDAKVVKKGENLVQVTLTANGSDKDEAIRDAKRKAVERGAGTYIYSHSETKDFMLVKDTILARAAGFVESFKEISSKKTADGMIELKAEVVVSIKGIEDTWGVVKNLLKDKGYPKFMIFVNEKIDGKLQDSSTVQTKLEELMIKNGFALVDKKQIKAIDEKDLQAAIAEDKPEKVQAIAKRFGAQFFITGTSEAAAGDPTDAYGVKLYKYGAKGNIRCFRTDTAQLLSSQTGTEYSADREKINAGNKSLSALGDKLSPVVQGDILRFWLDVMTGGGEVQLHVEAISFKQRTDLKNALKDVKDIKDVNTTAFANNIAEYTIQTTLTAEKLAEKLSDSMETLDITDVTQNVIKAKYKAKKE